MDLVCAETKSFLSDVKTPIISAAMAIPGIEDIAFAVTKAGGFGFVGNGT